MNTILCIMALFLMIVSTGLCFRKYSAAPGQGEVEGGPKNQSLITLLLVGGTLIACGGFWADWLLWSGLIIIEIGCIAWCLKPARASK